MVKIFVVPWFRRWRERRASEERAVRERLASLQQLSLPDIEVERAELDLESIVPIQIDSRAGIDFTSTYPTQSARSSQVTVDSTVSTVGTMLSVGDAVEMHMMPASPVVVYSP